MPYFADVAVILGLIAVNAFFAAAEIAVISLRGTRVRQLAESGSRSARALQWLTGDPSRFLATIQVGITLAGFLASAAAAVGIARALGGLLVALGLGQPLADVLAVLLVTVLVSFASLVLGELVPKRLALLDAEGIALRVARPVAVMARVAAPFTWLLTATTNAVLRGLGGPSTVVEAGPTEEELRMYVAEHRDLADEEKRLIEGVFHFGDRVARQVMVPRTEMDCIHLSVTVAEAARRVIATGRTRLPVFREDYDDIVGLVEVRPVLRALADGKGDLTVDQLMGPAHFVPETKRTVDLLKDMQAEDYELAVVVDEYGGTAGLITLADLVEEIVGEVNEAVDDEEFRNVSPDEVIVDGALEIEELNERLGVDLPVSPLYETTAGFILHTLGRIPREGEVLVHGGVQLQVLRMDHRRIDQVRVFRPAAPEAGGDAEGDGRREGLPAGGPQVH